MMCSFLARGEAKANGRNRCIGNWALEVRFYEWENFKI